VSPAVASERTVTFSPEDTRIEFQLPATGHDVHGAFGFDHGELRWDPETGEASGDLVVRAGGAATGSARRDKAMHRKVLESDLFPSFVLHVQKIEGDLAEQGECDLTVEGVLTVHGADHPVRWPIAVEVDHGHFHAEGKLEIPFVDWGMHNPSMLFLKVAEIVDVNVVAEGDIGSGSIASRPPTGAGPGGGE
jgi:polyisoprenoid-binding protein YceI